MNDKFRLRFYLFTALWLVLLGAALIPWEAAAQAGSSPWARHISATGADVDGYHVATDPAGNVYVAGNFTTTLSLGSTTFTGNGPDGFLAKYDAQGNVLWAYQVGGAGQQNVGAVATDADGNVFVGGQFTSAVSFGALALSAPGTVGYLAKFNAQGQPQWARVIGSGSGIAGISAVHADAVGALRIVGAYQQTTTVGPFPLTNGGSRSNTENTFLAGCSSTGAVLWATSLTSTENLYATDTALDGMGNLLLTGTLWGTGTFGTLAVTTVNPSQSAYVAKFNAQGTLQWVQQAGGTRTFGNSEGRAVAADATGNIYVGGFSTGPTSFGTLSHPDPNMYVARMDAQGNFVWVVADAQALYTDCRDLAVHPNGTLYAVGSFRYGMSAPPLALSNSGSSDAFLARYRTRDGQGLALSAGYSGTGADYGAHVAVDSYGNAHYTGQYRAGTGGTFYVYNHTLPGGPYYRMFLAREGAACPPATAPVIAGPASVCAGDTLTLTATTAAAPTLYQWSGPNGFTSSQATVRIPNPTAGTYQLTVNAGGCPATSAPYAVSVVLGPPQPTVSRQSSGATVTLTSSSLTGNQWYLNGAPIPGATAVTYTVSAGPSQAVYTVVVTNAAGCRSTPSAAQIITASRSSTAFLGLTVHPNPAPDGRIQVRWQPTAHPTYLRVVNGVGQLVLHRDVPAGVKALSLELANLPPGLYILQVGSTTALETMRLLRP
ncbi:hypothetical protein GCM10023185_33290 [Hymenobacter saemangeumensis]|uniref:PKD domain-containing protein n=1 Tax=Hymenobacter saemangeumensis TaxID=1084522 RepID=A0ABP8IPP1_9BACT